MTVSFALSHEAIDVVDRAFHRLVYVLEHPPNGDGRGYDSDSGSSREI